MKRIQDWFRSVADVGRQRIEINRLNKEVIDQRQALDIAAQVITRRDYSISKLEDELITTSKYLSQTREEAYRAEQCLTGIKAFARNTEYLQVRRVLLTMIGER
jgi:hypothetical protein